MVATAQLDAIAVSMCLIVELLSRCPSSQALWCMDAAAVTTVGIRLIGQQITEIREIPVLVNDRQQDGDGCRPRSRRTWATRKAPDPGRGHHRSGFVGRRRHYVVDDPHRNHEL